MAISPDIQLRGLVRELNKPISDAIQNFILGLIILNLI
jgi:hypothetical protein